MLGTIHKKNKDRYRIQFCDVNFYLSNQQIFALWKKRFTNLSSVEKVQAWAVGLCCLRRPNDWFSGERKFKFSAEIIPHSLTLSELFKDTPVKLPNKLNSQLNLAEFINHFRIKAIPESALRSLCFMSNKRYPLVVSNEIPSPKDLLLLQIEGTRIVSLNENHEEWPHTLYTERDHLGFLLHDLIHADHFLFETHNRDGQLGFYHFANSLFDDVRMNELLKSEVFKKGFEYIISDMNSHPLHLFQTLHSLLYSELKNDELAKEVWKSWNKLLLISEDEREALNSINASCFNPQMASTIENMCIKMGNKVAKSSTNCLKIGNISQYELN